MKYSKEQSDRSRDNAERLSKCSGHKFHPMLGGRHRCSVCGGEVDSMFRLGYEQGKLHGQGKS